MVNGYIFSEKFKEMCNMCNMCIHLTIWKYEDDNITSIYHKCILMIRIYTEISKYGYILNKHVYCVCITKMQREHAI